MLASHIPFLAKNEKVCSKSAASLKKMQALHDYVYFDRLCIK